MIQYNHTTLNCILYHLFVIMGRWDDSGGSSYSGSEIGGDNNRKKRNWFKLIRRLIFIGFAIVAVVILYVYFATSGLNAEVIQRGGPVETISIKLSNNNFYSISNVTVQFDNGQIQRFGNMGPFASIFITPEGGSSEFKHLLVTANNGEIKYMKNR